MIAVEGSPSSSTPCRRRSTCWQNHSGPGQFLLEGGDEIKAKAAAMVPVERPGDFAQAMMDLGAMICTPKHPSCGICPHVF
jgi:hypothetical protein